MTPALMDTVAARWTRLGALLPVAPADQTPDLERLLLDTARVAPANTRLFILAATWLADYGTAVDSERLAHLIRDDLEPAHRPTLGFLLESPGSANGSPNRLQSAIDACAPADGDPRPLSDIENDNPTFARLAAHRASPLSRKWGRWLEEFELKRSAIRPRHWIATNNPTLPLHHSLYPA